MTMAGAEFSGGGIEAICKAHWMDRKAQKAAVQIVRAFLEEAPEKLYSTSALMQKLGVPAELRTAFASRLAGARANGFLVATIDFQYGKPNGGTFGKPSIQWIGFVE